jgi:plasmid stability protein
MEMHVATMTIRNLDDRLKAKLRIQAAMHQRSMEDEARDILRTALSGTTGVDGSLAVTIRQRLGSSGGADLDLPKREPIRTPPDFSA